MLHGDISNVVSPRLLLVFEGLVGHVPPKASTVRAERLARKMHRWKSAVSYWEIDDLVAKVLADLYWRKDQTLHVVTWIGPEFAEALGERLDDENLPVSRTFHTTPERLARSIAYQHDIAAIYDPDPNHQFTFGGKGRIVTQSNLTSIGLF